MAGSRDNEHVITMRRPSAGICWRVTQCESMTKLLATFRRGGARPAAAIEAQISGQLLGGILDLTGRDHPAGRRQMSVHAPACGAPAVCRGNPAGRNRWAVRGISLTCRVSLPPARGARNPYADLY